MTLLKIISYPNPILNKVAEPLTEVSDETRTLIDNMLETMYDAPGIGLAAPQVAISKRIIVIDIGKGGGDARVPDPLSIINPVITKREGSIIWEEGCLSVPEILVPVERSKAVTVEGLSKDGDSVRFEAEDLLAVAFQHEIDHLDGVLLVDKLSRLKKDIYTKKLEKGQSINRDFVRTSSHSKAYIG